MNEPMQVWCRLYGPEKFEGELDYLMAARKAQPSASTSRAPRGSQPPALAKSPALLWRAARHLPDAYLVQGSCVLNWSGTQVQWIAIEGQALPLKDRPLVVLEPTLASVPQRLRRDPRSRAALEAMWDELDAEMEPLRLKFSLGQRSFELLSRIEQRFSSQAQYHLDDTNGSQATLQPIQRQLHINPQARSEQVIQATWRRRPASAQPSEIFEPMGLSQVLNVYCQRSTRRLYGHRLRSARISLRATAHVQLSELNDQVLMLLVLLRADTQSFFDLMQASDFDEHSLGNLLLGLYLSGIIALEIDAGVDTLFASSARPPSRDTLH